MMTRSLGCAPALSLPLFVLACAGPGGISVSESDASTSSRETSSTATESGITSGVLTETSETDSEDSGCPPGGCWDEWSEDDGWIPPCAGENCGRIDLLIVVDNSGTMGEEQLALGPGLSELLTSLHGLLDSEGQLLNPDVNIMVTSTDVGHPLCEPFAPDGYEPLGGAPQATPCIDRLEDFTGLGVDPLMFEQVCLDSCPVPIGPADPFIHFEGFEGSTTNVPGNNVEGALRCLAPQGINGCGFESPLEAMLQAINPSAPWNLGNKPFMRDDSTLAVVLVTDEADCSVRAPDGYAFFTGQDTYWELNPDTGTKTHPTSAVCWNAGVDCGMPDMDGSSR